MGTKTNNYSKKQRHIGYNQCMETVVHEIPPVYDGRSRILILGTMPSPKSRETGFYYGHPQNRFWKAIAAALCTPVPAAAERREYLLYHRIAMWDVLSRCDISGAADSSIKNPKANDFSAIFARADIKKVFCTGITAARLYQRLTGNACACLPSPSAANCRMGFDELVEAYRAVLPYLED